MGVAYAGNKASEPILSLYRGPNECCTPSTLSVPVENYTVAFGRLPHIAYNSGQIGS
jgi:hypothetical protein